MNNRRTYKGYQDGGNATQGNRSSLTYASRKPRNNQIYYNVDPDTNQIIFNAQDQAALDSWASRNPFDSRKYNRQGSGYRNALETMALMNQMGGNSTAAPAPTNAGATPADAASDPWIQELFGSQEGLDAFMAQFGEKSEAPFGIPEGSIAHGTPLGTIAYNPYINQLYGMSPYAEDHYPQVYGPEGYNAMPPQAAPPPPAPAPGGQFGNRGGNFGNEGRRAARQARRGLGRTQGNPLSSLGGNVEREQARTSLGERFGFGPQENPRRYAEGGGVNGFTSQNTTMNPLTNITRMGGYGISDRQAMNMVPNAAFQALNRLSGASDNFSNAPNWASGTPAHEAYTGGARVPIYGAGSGRIGAANRKKAIDESKAEEQMLASFHKNSGPIGSRNNPFIPLGGTQDPRGPALRFADGGGVQGYAEGSQVRRSVQDPFRDTREPLWDEQSLYGRALDLGGLEGFDEARNGEKVPVQLSNGEVIFVPPEAAQRHMERLGRIGTPDSRSLTGGYANGGQVQGYADGGTANPLGYQVPFSSTYRINRSGSPQGYVQPGKAIGYGPFQGQFQGQGQGQPLNPLDNMGQNTAFGNIGVANPFGPGGGAGQPQAGQPQQPAFGNQGQPQNTFGGPSRLPQQPVNMQTPFGGQGGSNPLMNFGGTSFQWNQNQQPAFGNQGQPQQTPTGPAGAQGSAMGGGGNNFGWQGVSNPLMDFGAQGGQGGQGNQAAFGGPSSFKDGGGVQGYANGGPAVKSKDLSKILAEAASEILGREKEEEEPKWWDDIQGPIMQMASTLAADAMSSYTQPQQAALKQSASPLALGAGQGGQGVDPVVARASPALDFVNQMSQGAPAGPMPSPQIRPPQGMAQKVPQGMPQRPPQGMPQSPPQGPQRLPQGMPQRPPQGMQQRPPQGQQRPPQGMPQNKPRMPLKQEQGRPQEGVPGSAVGTGSGSIQGGAPQEREYIDAFNATTATLDQVDELQRLYGDGEQFEVWPRMQMAWISLRRRFGDDNTTPEEDARLYDFARTRQAALVIMNNYIKQFAGATVSGAEEARMMGFLPDIGDSFNPFDGDDPETFQAKVDGFRRNIMQVRIRASMRLALGATNTPLDFITLDEAESEFNRRAGQYAQELRQANPNMSEGAARQEAVNRLKEELGL